MRPGMAWSRTAEIAKVMTNMLQQTAAGMVR